jgi:hypothetical protein
MIDIKENKENDVFWRTLKNIFKKAKKKLK